MKREHERRLWKLETGAGSDEPTAMFSFRPLEDDEAAHILANWRDEVAARRTNLSHGTLYVLAPVYATAEEWLASVKARDYAR